MKKLAHPPNKYPYLLFLILLFFSTTHAQSPVNQATASDYPYRESSHLRANQSPVVSLTVSPTTGKLPLLITADASGSSDSDGSIVKFEWFIDGESLGVPEDVGTIKFTFQGEGTYLIAVTVTDNQGLTASKQQKIKVTTTDVVNQSPVANFTVTPTQGEAPLTVKVDASDSSDDETIASYQWQVSDGQTDSGIKASFTFKIAGDYTLVLTVTDDQGLTATKQQTVQVTAKPVVNQPPEANFTVTPTQGEAPLTVNVDASESSDEGKIASYQWKVSDGQTASGVKASFTFDTTGNYTITLTVKDDKGATATQTETVEVIAKTVQPSSTTLPSLGENFSGGIAVNDQPPQPQAVLKLADIVDVTGTITVNPADIGKTADIFVYAEATLPPSEDKLYFMLGEGLTISLWDENPANLVAFQRNVTLGAVQTVSMYQGKFIYPGNLKIFFGYRLPEGTLVTNSDPITITISQQGEPQFRGLVQVTPTDTDKVTLAWLPATDDDTPPEAITYQVHLSDQPNFTPSTATLQTAVTGQEKTEVTGLATGQTYNVLVVAVDQDGNESLERDYRTATTFADPVIVNPNTKTCVDTNVGLGTATTSDGVTFNYPDSGGVMPEVGCVLFSTVGDEIYLRKVTDVTPQGNGVVVQTEDADLSEVLEQATIDNNSSLFDVNEAAETTNSRTGVRTQRSLGADGSRYTVMEWPDKFLVATQIDAAGDDGEVSVSPGVRRGSSTIRLHRESDKSDTKVESDIGYNVIVKPVFQFEPELETTVVWTNDPLKGFQILGGKVIARGNLSAVIGAEFNFEGSAKVEKEIPFPLLTRYYRSVYMLGTVPVYQRIKFTLSAVLSATAASKIQASSEAKATASLETGVRFNGTTGQWDILPVELNFEKSFTASLNAHSELTGEIRLIPNIEVTFYFIAATNLSIEPFLKGKIAVDLMSKADLLKQHGYLEAQLTNFDFALQAQGFIGASFKMFKEFPVLKKTQLFETPEWELFNLPKLEFAKENGNSTKVGEPLELAVTVKDGANNPFNDGSIQWWVVPDTGAITPTSNRTATFVPSKEGEYTIFFSGHSRLPDPIGRQFMLTEVSVGTGEKPKVAGHGIPSVCPEIPKDRCLDIPNRCTTLPKGTHGSYVKVGNNNVKNGEWINVLDNVFTVETYSLGVLNGPEGAWSIKDCSPVGTILTDHGSYQDGKKEGTWTSFGLSRDFFVIDTYVNGILEGPYGFWSHPSCKPRADHGNYRNGKKDGIWTHVDSNIGIINYVQGVKEGTTGTWSLEDCRPILNHGSYINDKQEGIWTFIGGSGNYNTTTYVNGLKQGIYGDWNADGSPKDCHGEYASDKRVGVWTCYKYDGTTHTETYVDGVKQ